MLHRTQTILLLLTSFFSLTTIAQPASQELDMAERVEACAGCHGEHGRSQAEAYFPSIAGKPAGYLFSQMKNYREGRRRHAIMESMFAYLSNDYLKDIAAYYSRQQPAWAPAESVWSAAALERGRQLVEHGDTLLDVPSCKACHGDSLKGVAPAIPGLLGMRPEYLSAQLGAWRTGVRKAEAPDCMATVARRLSRTDISAVTAWIAARPLSVDHAPEAALTRELPLACGGVQ